MDITDFLAFDLKEVENELTNQGYHINDVKFLNEPLGNPRIVRIKAITSENVEILVSYQRNDLALNT